MKRVFLLFALCTAVITMNSCYSDPAPGVGTIVVLDPQDFRVPAAYVRLSQPGQSGNGIILNEGYTGINGEYSYEHTDPTTGLALEVILDIYASSNGRVGQGIIRIKPGETTVEEVTIF
jgi:hypothetical protein